MLSPQEFALKYKTVTQRKKSFAVCFWGHWHGGPTNAKYKIISAIYQQDMKLLIIEFSGKEVLKIVNPSLVEELPNRLEIKTADKVIWEWFDHTKEFKSKKKCQLDFYASNGKITGKSSIHWSAININDLSIKKPAVLLYET